MVARKTIRRKKATPLPRKPRTGIAAAPTKSFHAFQDYFRLDLDRKDIAGVLRTYIRENFEGEERDMMCTLQEGVVPAATKEDPLSQKKVRAVNEEVIPVWDVNANGWRSFRVDSVISFS